MRREERHAWPARLEAPAQGPRDRPVIDTLYLKAYHSSVRRGSGPGRGSLSLNEVA
jgi:hypothetical protein